MHTIHDYRRGAAAIIGAVLTAALFSACSSSEDAAKTATTAAARPTASGTVRGSDAAQAAPAAATQNVVTVRASEAGDRMTYHITGTPRPGLVSIEFVNTGKYAHEMTLSLMKPGVTLAQLKSALTKSERAAQALLVDPGGEITGPSIVGPGNKVKVATRLAAGHYAVTCFLPGPDGMPHVAMGMLGEVTVDGPGPGATAPTTAGTVTLTDHSITLPDNFGSGDTYKVSNTGTKPHDVSVAKLAGKPLLALFQCIAGSFGKGTPIDKCPGRLVGGVTQLKPGESAYLTLRLGAGSYGYVSTHGDGADYQAGLNGTFTIK